MAQIFFKIILLYLAQNLISHSARADDCQSIPGNTVVFGGLGSKTADMQLCYPDFLSVSYEEGSKLVSCLADHINHSKGQKFLIAGHSSGAANAENLVHLVHDKTSVQLVLLEGWAYKFNQRGKVKTMCWYATNRARNLKSFNAGAMLDSAICPQPAKEFEAPWCETDMCLHVSNVNLVTPGNLSRKTAIETALAHCVGNREWVKASKAWMKP